MDATNFVNAFENFGKTLFSYMTDIKSLYFSTFLFFFFLLFALFLALMHVVPGFGSGKKPNKSGKVVAFVLAFIITLATYRVGSMEEVLSKILPTYGIFGMAVLGVFFFAVIYYGFKREDEGRWQLVILGSGLGMAIVGYFITQPLIQAVGWLVAVVWILLYMSSTGVVKEAIKNSK